MEFGGGVNFSLDTSEKMTALRCHAPPPLLLFHGVGVFMRFGRLSLSERSINAVPGHNSTRTEYIATSTSRIRCKFKLQILILL